MDFAIPVVFPDYLILVAQVKKTSVDLLPFVEFDNFTVRDTKLKLPELGHAGVLLLDGSRGVVKYHEFGSTTKRVGTGAHRQRARSTPGVLEECRSSRSSG